MGRFFSDTVEQALRDIYYQMWTGRGQEAMRNLEQASAAGDGDASCLLARCYCGDQYVWDGHHFPEDDLKATKLLHKSVEQGSAIGVLVALRSRELTPELMQKMPFASLQEAFDEVLAKAQAGEPFCQYTIGNSYFWWDFISIQGKDKNDFASQEELRSYLRENIVKCEDWFWKAFRGGVFWGGNNLKHYYQNGDEDLVLPQPEKAQDINRIGAEYGYPNYQYNYGAQLRQEKQYDEAFRWLKKALEGGEVNVCYYLGVAYELGQGVETDAAKAAEYYKKGLEEAQFHRIGCSNRLGALYYDGKGVPQDYAKAFQLLKWAYDQDTTNNWGAYYLGSCYAHGYGTQQDYALARKFLEMVDWQSKNAFYLLGYLYARGLGGPEDIQKGVALLQKAGDHSQAQEELKHYKKTFFGGKWVRR
ncbi:tetratricopeptide repeat protein [Angelakisella massiliensis]|uniref:tetratricopeptide repeat protein n=1 Tax=Angelakisella massiliensis TaxID=1871018 RepID=UPI0008F9493A|nr:tetratricopeptide repeat protein [Angelakisella massiliensis]